MSNAVINASVAASFIAMEAVQVGCAMTHIQSNAHALEKAFWASDSLRQVDLMMRRLEEIRFFILAEQAAAEAEINAMKEAA